MDGGNFFSEHRHEAQGVPGAKQCRGVLPRSDDAATARGDRRPFGVLAIGFADERELPDAERAFQRAIALNQNSAEAHVFYAEFLCELGRFDEAIAQAARAQELAPVSPLVSALSGFVFYAARRHDEAIAECRKALDLDAHFLIARSYLGASCFLESRIEEGIREIHRAIESSDRNQLPLAHLGSVYAMSGDRTRAREIIAELERRRGQEHISADHIATIYANMGEAEKACAWLETAYQERAPLLGFLKHYPFPSLEPLFSDARFQDLVRRLGLP